MNWKEASISYFGSKFWVFGVLPTFIAILLNSLFGQFVKGGYNLILIYSFLILSFPHFTLSIKEFAVNGGSLNPANKRGHLLFILILFGWASTFILLDGKLSLIPLCVLFGYQSYHYAMQSYGIFRYFDGKSIYKILYLLLGLLFFLNLGMHSLKEASLMSVEQYHEVIQLFTKLHICLLTLTLLATLFFDRLNSQIALMRYVTLMIWFVWVYMSIDLQLLLFLPLLHSLQYLPFVQKKIVAGGKKEYKLWIDHTLFILVITAFALIVLNYPDFFNQRILLTTAIAINLIHIHIDSYLWKTAR